MKIEFQKSTVRLSFLCGITDFKIAWINPWKTIINIIFWIERALLIGQGKCILDNKMTFVEKISTVFFLTEATSKLS